MQYMGKYQEALDEYNIAVQLDGGKGPRAYEVYVKMGEVLQAAGDLAQALQAYDAAVSIGKNQVRGHRICTVVHALESQR
jgi:tetratricopeptide (TPR) repeat protein